MTNLTSNEMEHERELDKVMKERDDAEEQADKLAECIEALLDIEIGEHSSGNEPWQNAIDAAEYELDKRKRQPPAAPAANPVNDCDDKPRHADPVAKLREVHDAMHAGKSYGFEQSLLCDLLVLIDRLQQEIVTLNMALYDEREGITAACKSSPETRASIDVLAERQRQVSVEGWTTEHDDQHQNGDLLAFAIRDGSFVFDLRKKS